MMRSSRFRCLWGRGRAARHATPRSTKAVRKECFKLTDAARLVLQTGDLTLWEGDAIVNAANEMMLGGGGVDGAIHRRAGPQLKQACLEVPELEPGCRCRTGDARITPGFKLRARFVIHTVGPIYVNQERSAPLLESAYRSSLKLANKNSCETVAFPAISCGVFGYPLAEAAQVALDTAKEHVGSLREVHFVLFGQDTWKAYLNYAKSTFQQEQCEVPNSPSSPDQGEDSERPTGSSAMDESQGGPVGEVADHKEGNAKEVQDSAMESTPDPPKDDGLKESPPPSPKTNNKGSPKNEQAES